ncbi:hypothetical protein JTE90_017345 [Oedothorax gibbosus]|uniref:Uncharacterized protein n=1 Tax=Oedothorax gibbosus TaxID=931172 RepID=A0AAV6TIT8_9ARAC|nr:hypothetical protein JTE90_017345 [Oedothorax gibbosus]
MGTDRHENYTISLGFSRANRGAPDTARDAVLLREQRPYLRTSRFQGHELLQRKDNSSPGPPSTSPSSVALPHLVPKDLSPCPGWGILTPFPFGRQRDKHEHVFAFRQTSRFGTDFSDPLGPTDPCSTAVHMEPFSSFSPQGSHLSICYYHQDLHRWRLQAGSRPAPFNARHRDPPTHCGVNLHEGSSAVAARYRPNAGASSIFRASCFGR